MGAISNPYGMVLVTGPTGSGKTTTLYSALSQINHDGVNIMTVEGPGGVQPPRDQPGPRPHRDRDGICDGAQGVPEAGPEHHYGR